MSTSVTVPCSCCEASCEDCGYEDTPAGCLGSVIAFSKTVSAGSSCNNKGFAVDTLCYECVDCIYDDYGWSPSTDTVCVGVEFQQTHSSGYAPKCEGCTPGENSDGSHPCPDKTRTRIGTKEDCTQCTNPHSPNYNPEATEDDESCITCENSGSCSSGGGESNPGLPGMWSFDTKAPPVGPCPDECLHLLWSKGITGWGNAISCSSGTDESFIVKNTSCTKGLRITVKSNPNITVTLKTFTIGGKQVTGGSATGGTFSFDIPPGSPTTDITGLFTANYSCVCAGGNKCRAGVVATAPTYSYFDWDFGGAQPVCPQDSSIANGCCHACCAGWGNCAPSESSSFTAENGVYYPSCYG